MHTIRFRLDLSAGRLLLFRPYIYYITALCDGDNTGVEYIIYTDTYIILYIMCKLQRLHSSYVERYFSIFSPHTRTYVESYTHNFYNQYKLIYILIVEGGNIYCVLLQ